MNVEVVIQKLRSIGYRIRTDGKDILLNADREPPNAEMVIYLLTELKKCKAEVINILQMEESQQPVNVNDAWPPKAQLLVDWFLTLDPPSAPFYLEPHIHVLDPAKFFEKLRHEIEVGPRGPRTRTGALQSDLQKLKTYFELNGGIQ